VNTTAFPELDAVLAQLVAGLRATLGDNLVGVYLQGSFAVGDADEHSDVDFLVVIERELTEDEQTCASGTPRAALPAPKPLGPAPGGLLRPA
jgi:hypothetical protein